jgi:hypothetical protein
MYGNQIQNFGGINSSNTALTDTKNKAQYLSKIDSLNSEYTAMLSDYKTRYITYQNNTQNPDNKRSFDQIDQSLKTNFATLFSLNYEIIQNNQIIIRESSDINKKIASEKEKNIEFKKKLKSLDPIQKGSALLISDYTENYNDKNTRNWSLLIGIFVSIAIIVYVFRIPTSRDKILATANETITKLRKDGSEIANKYNSLEEAGKKKAEEAETKIKGYYDKMKEYQKRADQMVLESKVSKPNL